jgi:hypothetical protein
MSARLYGLPRREVDSRVDTSAILSPASHRVDLKEREVLHNQIHRELVYRPLQFKKLSQLFMSAHDEPLFVAMRVLLALSAVVENGYDR